MDMSTMSTGMIVACGLFGLLVTTFLVVWTLAGIKYLRSPTEPKAIPNAQRSVTGARAA